MLKRIKNLPLEHITNFLFCLLPISFILGNSIVHLNLYAFLILSILYIKEENYKINFSLSNKILICFFILIIISSTMNYFVGELKELNKFGVGKLFGPGADIAETIKYIESWCEENRNDS